MLALVSLVVLVSVGLLIFSSQNTLPVTIQLGFTTVHSVPLNIALLVAVIVGILLTWVVTFVTNLTNYLLEDSKRREREEWNKVLVQLTKRLHKAELAIDQLKHPDGNEDESSL